MLPTRAVMQIACSEIAAGTYDKWFALFINLPALAYGFLIWPRDCLAAWRAGKASSSLYRYDYSDDLLALRLEELKDMVRGEKE